MVLYKHIHWQNDSYGTIFINTLPITSSFDEIKTSIEKKGLINTIKELKELDIKQIFLEILGNPGIVNENSRFFKKPEEIIIALKQNGFESLKIAESLIELERQYICVPRTEFIISIDIQHPRIKNTLMEIGLTEKEYNDLLEKYKNILNYKIEKKFDEETYILRKVY